MPNKVRERDFIMNKKNRNKGFTLIELIVTIAIMAIVTGATMSVYSFIKTNRLRALSENVNDVISDLRSATLAKSGNYSLTISYDSSKKSYIAQITKSETKPDGSVSHIMYKTKSIGTKGEIYCKDSGSEYKLSDGYSINIRFNKADGSFSAVNFSKSGHTVNNVTEIYVEYAGNVKTVKLITLTGKHYIE